MKNLTLEDVSKLLGKKELPGTEAELRTLVRWTNDLVERNGKDYVRKHSKHLLEEWDYIRTSMGVPGTGIYTD